MTLRRSFLVLPLVAAAALALFALADRPEAPAAFRDRAMARRDGPKSLPSEWFTVQRAWPGSEIPYARVREALARTREMRAEAAIAGLPGAWTEEGPENIGGRVTALAVNPSNPDIMWAGAALGGVFKTTDGGASWTPLTDYLGSISVGALALDPANPNVLYLGSGEANSSGDSYSGIGILKSTDGGSNWTLLGLEESHHIGRIVVDPVDPNTVWAAVMGKLFGRNDERGVYKSTDGGLSWSRKLFMSDSTGCVDIVVHPTRPDTVYAAMWERIRRPEQRTVGGLTSGIWRSYDGGATWTRLAGGLPAPAADVGRIGLAIAKSSPGTLYAIYADDPGFFAGVYKTTNGGDSWTRTSDGALDNLYSNFGWYFGNIRVDPTTPNRAWAMGLDIYRTNNGGSSWFKTSFGMHVDQHDLWIDPALSTHQVAGNDGGVYESNNGANPWTKYVDLPITQFYAGTIDPLNPARLYGGTQDNGTMRTPSGGTGDWEEIYGGDGFYCLVDPRDSDVVYAEYQYGGLGKSTDGGNNWSDATFGIDGDDRRNWSTPVAMDPGDPDVLYYGTYRLWKSGDGAGSWTAVSGDLTDGPGGGTLVFGTLTTIAVAPTDPDVIYAGCDDGNVWVTEDGGGAWSSIRAGLPDRWVTRVAVDPLDDATCYVTLSGYKEDSLLPHVLKSVDHGATWTDISANLPDMPVNDIVVDPDHADHLYLGTDFGVFHSADGGGYWYPLGNNLPVVSVFDLTLHNPSRILVAHTHGRSMWSYPLDGTTSVAGTPGGRPGGEGATLALAAAPNPFRERSEFSFRLEAAGEVTVRIFDVRGRLVRDLFRGEMGAGARSLAWDGRTDGGAAAAAGTYYARLETAAGAATRELALAR